MNILTHLPGSPSARYLRRLDLHGINITELPVGLARLTTLRELDISGSAVNRIHVALGDIKLERFAATGCELAHAPYAMR